MNELNESVLKSFKQFLQTYESGKSGPNVNTSSLTDISTVDVADLSCEMQTVVLRSRTTTDSCLFSDHKISPNDVEPEVFDWIFYHLDYKKCPHPLAFALASIVSRKLGLAETTRESHSDADKSKPAISSNELYSQSLEYLTDYISSWKDNPEIAVEIAKEYSTQCFPSSICAIKNIRRKMEDRHVVLHDLNKALALKTSKQYSYYAIFDGHAGVDAASYASAHLHYNLVKSNAFLDGDIVGAFKEAFSETDLHYLERSAREGKKSGSTALCALLEDMSKIYIAWLGDSLAILVRNGKPIDIMIPHKPDLEEERKRIEEMGGFVAFVDTWRVNGTLAVSRAIGDPEYKPYISSEPDVVQLDIDSETDFLILGCDGLWDQLTPEEATSLVYEYICENNDQNIEEITRNVASHLSKTAKFDGSSDNITTIVIFFKDLAELRSTPFTPLTPREKNETNGFNGNHFQYNDFEFTQSNAKNPFDLTSDSDEMNTAKLNFEISDSINSSENNSTNESKGISNPFSSNDYSFADLNKPFDMSVDKNHLNNESSLLKEPTNSFEINNKLESDTSQTNANDCSELQSFQSDSQFNISKLSEISSSFPTQAVIHSDNALCSTPIPNSDPYSFESKEQQNIVLETNLDLTDGTQDYHSMSESQLEANVMDFSQSRDSFGNHSFVSVESDFNETNSFDKTGYQTAYECDFEQHLNESIKSEEPLKSPINLEEVCQQVFSDIDDQNTLSNQNQDINDFSSGAESVDSFCYEKIGSDLSKISEKVANDYQLQQMYGSAPTDSDQQTESQQTKDEVFDSSELGTASDVEQTNSHLMAEALIAEHMTPEEAQEVVHQLITEKKEVDPTQEVLEEPIHQIISEDVSEKFTQNEQNLFELNESETQQKAEEMIFKPSDEDSMVLINQESTAQTIASNVLESDISSQVSEIFLQESKVEPIIHDFTSVSQLSFEDQESKHKLEETISPQVLDKESNYENTEELISSRNDFSPNEVIPEFQTKEEFGDISEDKNEESIDKNSSFNMNGRDLMNEELIESPTATKAYYSEPTPEPCIESYTNGFKQIESNVDPTPEQIAEVISDTTPEPTIELTSDLTPELTADIISDLMKEPAIDLTLDETLLPKEDLISNMTPELTSEITFAPTPELTVELTSAPTPELTVELTSAPTPELTVELTSAPTPELTVELTSAPTPELTVELTSAPTPELTVELTSAPTPELTVELTSAPTPELTVELTSAPTPELTVELTSAPTPELTVELTSAPTPELTVEQTSAPTTELTVELTPTPTTESQNEMKFETELSSIIPAEEESKGEALFEAVVDENNILIDSETNGLITNEPQTEKVVQLLVEEIKPEEELKEVPKTAKALNSKSVPSKTSKPQTKTDPKSKPSTTSSTLNKPQPKPLGKVAATSKLNASSATTRLNSGPTAKTTTAAKPMAVKTANNSVARTAAPKPMTAATSRVSSSTGTLGKSMATAKPAISRVAPSASTSRVAPTATSKPATKPVSTRAPIASRMTASTISSRTTTSPSRTFTAAARANGLPPSSTGAPTKLAVNSTLTRKITTSSKTSAAPVNGTKSVGQPLKTTSVGLKSTINKSGRTAPTKTTTSPTKTTKPIALSAQNKTGVKPISIKGKTVAKDISKPSATNVNTNGVSKTVTTMTTSMSSKNNYPLKVANSLKQELEDAMSQPNIESPSSGPDMSTPDVMDRAFILSASLESNSSPNITENE